MTLSAKQLVNAELPTSNGTLYTVPGSTKTRISEVLLCNCAGAARTATLHFVESGDSADTGAGAGVNAFMKTFDLPQGVPIILPMNSWLEAGDTIQGLASGADVAIFVSGFEET